MPGKLYIVPTPVGNMADMTPRAVETLSSVDIVYAEDTRTSSVLFRHFGIDTPLVSYHKFNEHAALGKIIDKLLGGSTVALISDAGTPGISDPGFLIARACRQHGIEVETLPGATAFVPALMNSGLPADRFFFEGFLPQKKGRKTRLEFLSTLPCTFIVYESPLRLVRTLQELAEYCAPTRRASVSREISKIHNSTVNGTIAQLVEHYAANTPKGEIVIVIEGTDNIETSKKEHQNKYKPAQPN